MEKDSHSSGLSSYWKRTRRARAWKIQLEKCSLCQVETGFVCVVGCLNVRPTCTQERYALSLCVSCGYPPKGCDCGGHTASSYKSIRHAIKIAVARHQRTFRQTKNWKKYVSEKKKNNKSNLSTSSNTQLVMPRSIVRRPCCMRSRLSFS